jgi:RNA polymerase sigma factor (sigma-70 family)
MVAKTVAELVDEARHGSADARDELVRRHYREIALVAVAITNDPTEAEDLSQEAFIRAFRNLDLLVDPDRFAAWLRRIAVGVSIDWLRSFRPNLYRGWDGSDDVAASTRPSPLDRLLRAEMTARVSAALDALPPRYRVPVRLYHLDGLSHAKIAASLDVPVATVRSLVARARRKLAPLLAEYAPDRATSIDDVFEEQIVIEPASTRYLHVANGTCTTRVIEAAAIPGAQSIWADVLYEGPVPAGSDNEVLEARRRFHAGAPEAVLRDPANDMRRWRSVIDAHDAYDELVLWYEHDLFDQLNLIQLLSWLRRRLAPPKRVSLVTINAFPGHAEFKGLGELSADELASLFDTRRPISDGEYAVADRAWDAFRAPTPEPLDALRRAGTAPLPYLAPALDRFLQEYPAVGDGLSRSERRLLSLAADGPIALRALFPRMHRGEEVYYITDSSLAELATTLSRTSPPLLTIVDHDGAGERSLNRTVAVTEAGREVLAGSRDRVACGIDRWLGGVHLHDGGDMWRYEEARRRIVRSTS